MLLLTAFLTAYALVAFLLPTFNIFVTTFEPYYFLNVSRNSFKLDLFFLFPPSPKIALFLLSSKEDAPHHTSCRLAKCLALRAVHAVWTPKSSAVAFVLHLANDRWPTP
jgi:hypothetical protein